MTLDWSVLWDYRGLLLAGAATTIELAVLTMAGAVVLGLLLAFARIGPIAALRWAAAAFTEFFRATPLLLQVYWAFYVLPTLTGVALSPFATALIGLIVNVGSYNAETFRAGILSIRQGQRYAGLALGMTRLQVMRHVVLPQAVRRVTPALASTWVSLFKDTSLVSVIAVADLSYAALQVRAETYRVLEVLTGMAALYWLMGYPQAKLVDWIYSKYRTVE